MKKDPSVFTDGHKLELSNGTLVDADLSFLYSGTVRGEFKIHFYAVAGWWYQVRAGEGGKGHVCGKGLAAVLVAGMERVMLVIRACCTCSGCGGRGRKGA